MTIWFNLQRATCPVCRHDLPQSDQVHSVHLVNHVQFILLVMHIKAEGAAGEAERQRIKQGIVFFSFSLLIKIISEVVLVSNRSHAKLSLVFEKQILGYYNKEE